MLTCRRSSRLISDQHERPLSAAMRLFLGVHLLGCRPCRRFRRAVRWLDLMLPSAAQDATLSAEARERIRRVLEQARSSE